MSRFPVRPALIAVATGVLAVFVGACGSGEDAPEGAKTMSFELTDAGCVPHTAKAPAGPIVFEVENAGSAKVTELEVLDGEAILGEVENLSEGLSGNFSLTLKQGEYTLRCNGGSDEDGTLTVTGSTTAKTNPGADAAVSRYRDYLERSTAELVTKTTPFVEAVEAGEIGKAKSLYAPARIPYERIEPVAESFGDLDPRIHARENDVPAGEF
ncbi:MAG TPA: cupredoxin domain-containing protein, partial [Solirubrobacterales bacterium]|nr:cupredoxin domain-containing protein [Solirubrobacterales bacterium]